MHVGQTFKRREPVGDPIDEIVVTGWIDSGHGFQEVAVAPLTFGPTVAADPESLLDAYTPMTGDPEPVEAEVGKWETRLEELEADRA